MLIMTLALVTLVSNTPEQTRLGQLERDETAACYGVGKGRKSTPIRENYLTFSDVVGEIDRGRFFFGHRVTGENKVLVLTPTANGPIGIARLSFLVEVDRKHCAGDTLYAPAFDTLQAWGAALPGRPDLPSVANANQEIHQGCYAAKAGAAVQNGKDKAPLAKGTLFFGGDPLDGKGVSAKLQILDPKSGASVGTVARSKVQRVARSKCAGL